MKTLVIGYGNTLRGDDGVGYRVAESVEAWQLPGVQAIACHQLTPELAADMATGDRVIFVDATLPGSCETITWQPLSLAAADLDTHHSSPAALLHLAATLFQQYPTAYQLLLPTAAMDFTETLSPVAARGMVQALQRIHQFCEGPPSVTPIRVL